MFDRHAAYCLVDDLRMLANPVRRSSTARAEEAVTEMSGRNHEHHALRSLTLRQARKILRDVKKGNAAVLLGNIMAIGMGVTDQELIVGFAEIGTWQNTPYRFGRHLTDLRVEVNRDRHRLSSDLTLDKGACVFCYPQGRNAPNGLARIGPGLAARRRRGVRDGEGIILPLSIAIRDALPAEDHTEDPGLRRVSDVRRKDDRCDRHGRKKERCSVASVSVEMAT